MRAWLRDTAGGLPATYWYLWTGLLINRVGGFAVLFLGSLWAVGPLAAFLAALLGAAFGAVLGLVVGTISGACLACAQGHVLGHDWCARRLAFTTSAAPFLVCFGLLPAGERGRRRFVFARAGRHQSRRAAPVGASSMLQAQ